MDEDKNKVDAHGDIEDSDDDDDDSNAEGKQDKEHDDGKKGDNDCAKDIRYQLASEALNPTSRI